MAEVRPVRTLGGLVRTLGDCIPPAPCAASAGKLSGLPRDEALQLAARHPAQCCLGTTVRGLFSVSPPAEFGEMSYEEEVKALTDFANDLEKLAGKAAAAQVPWGNRSMGLTCGRGALMHQPLSHAPQSLSTYAPASLPCSSFSLSCTR